MAMTDQELQQTLQAFQQKMMQKQQEAMSKKQEEMKAVAEKNKADGKKFLDDNAKKADVKTTASGLEYKVIKEGKGDKPTDADVVETNYGAQQLTERNSTVRPSMAAHSVSQSTA